MSEIAIQVEGLSKQYRLGEREPYSALRDVLARTLRAPWKVFQRTPKETFWALKDVNLEVRHGEVLGLIGRNGAGKTTLLKILSRITWPTSGWAEIYGRVGSLLEVGTGFHPELTGRENTFLSGAILGMGKSEIKRKFDEIIAFAELEQFIDTPVKHYSSGMYVRLAFAVAAHLEPEILLVDEVLAVGDIRFQKKCLGKMGDVARAGRTVVLVSHNIGAINALSSRVVLMKDGKISMDGRPSEATARYYAESLDVSESGASLLERKRDGNGKALFSSVSVQPLNASGERMEIAYPGCDLRVQVEIECREQITDTNVAVIFLDMSGYRVIDVNTAQKGEVVSMKAGQKARVQFLMHDVLLKPGKYSIGLWIGRHNIESIDLLDNAIILDVMEGEETNQHSVIYPGTYLCRFENDVTIS